MRWIGPSVHYRQSRAIPSLRSQSTRSTGQPAREPRSPVLELFRRFLIALGLLALMVLIVVVDRDGYNDNHDGRVDLIDSIYYATVTLTTTGYGDITPVTPAARLVNAFIVTPLRIAFLVVLVGTTLQVLAAEGRRVMRDTRWRKRMKDHTVVVGYGTKGRSAVQTLISNGVKRETIVVIDPRAQAIGDAGNDQMAAFHGDATNRTVLRRAEVMTAREVIVTTDRDDSAVLVTLAVRQLNPNAHVVVAVREEDNVPILRQSGADAVVTSSEAVGRLLGLSAVSPNLGEVMEDLLTVRRGPRGGRTSRPRPRGRQGPVGGAGPGRVRRPRRQGPPLLRLVASRSLPPATNSSSSARPRKPPGPSAPAPTTRTSEPFHRRRPSAYLGLGGHPARPRGEALCGGTGMSRVSRLRRCCVRV